MENKEKEYITKMLMNTKRKGMDKLINYMDEAGFFSCPASTSYHGAKEGGLAEHSLNVLNTAWQMAYALLGEDGLKEYSDSITICALLHDLGKVGQFGKPYYIDNVLKSGKKSESKPYTTNSDLMTLPHEITSVIEISKYIELTEEEQRAIAWHNGLYGAFKYDIQGKETPLYMIIHFADMWASRVVERI